jgi:hypothetical protein
MCCDDAAAQVPAEEREPDSGQARMGWWCGANMLARVPGSRIGARSPASPASSAARYRAMSVVVE